MLSPPREAQRIHLDELIPLQMRVGYGQLGTLGNLGYEGKRVVVQGRTYAHALSSHPPARLFYHLDGRFAAFRCEVAINDDVGTAGTHADFAVIVDGVRAADVKHLRAGEPPRKLAADLRGAQCLELAVETSRWEFCHAVWLEPFVDASLTEAAPSSFQDCLQRAEINSPAIAPRAGRCIATVVSNGYEGFADDMLGSLFANGDCQDAMIVIFMLGHSTECLRLASKYNALVVSCRARAAVNPMSKALLYSVAQSHRR